MCPPLKGLRHRLSAADAQGLETRCQASKADAPRCCLLQHQHQPLPSLAVLRLADCLEHQHGVTAVMHRLHLLSQGRQKSQRAAEEQQGGCALHTPKPLRGHSQALASQRGYLVQWLLLRAALVEPRRACLQVQLRSRVVVVRETALRGGTHLARPFHSRCAPSAPGVRRTAVRGGL